VKFVKILIFTLDCVAVILLMGKNSLAAEVAIIANPSVKEDTLNKSLLYDVYRGEVRTWEDGTKIKVWDLGEKGDVRDSFYDFIGMRPSRMKSLWMRKLLTGEGDPPSEAETQEKMLKSIIDTPGAIGYVNKDLVDKRVKLLMVIEKE